MSASPPPPPAATPSAVDGQAASQPEAVRPGPDRFLVGIVVGAVLLIVAGLVVGVLLRTPRTAPPADPASVAGVVQAHIEAVRTNDTEKARSYLTREARAQAEARERQNPTTYRPTYDNSVRIIVEATEQTETTAEARITVSRFYARSDPFSSSTSHRTYTVKLIREDGQWRLTQPVDSYMLT
ncbi:MAG: hypothetical protein IT306_20695 [Chloroflexi bacterium]|nr:hypothetical protein [Chloroflexota bacterium]